MKEITPRTLSDVPSSLRRIAQRSIDHFFIGRWSSARFPSHILEPTDPLFVLFRTYIHHTPPQTTSYVKLHTVHRGATHIDPITPCTLAPYPHRVNTTLHPLSLHTMSIQHSHTNTIKEFAVCLTILILQPRTIRELEFCACIMKPRIHSHLAFLAQRSVVRQRNIGRQLRVGHG